MLYTCNPFFDEMMRISVLVPQVLRCHNFFGDLRFCGSFESLAELVLQKTDSKESQSRRQNLVLTYSSDFVFIQLQNIHICL